MPSRPSSSRFKRCWIALAGGLLALCLQLGAQVMPAEAMQGAMRAAALTPAEAQSFAATCLGLQMPAKSDPAKPGQHASCPVCFTLAQSHGFAAPDVALNVTSVWTRTTPTPMAEMSASADTEGRAFYAQAPPAASA